MLLFLNQVSWTYSGQVNIYRWSKLRFFFWVIGLTDVRKSKREYTEKWNTNFSLDQALIFCLATAFNAFIKLPYSREKVKSYLGNR